MSANSRMLHPLAGSPIHKLAILAGYASIAADGTVSASHFVGGTFTGDTGVYTLTLSDDVRFYADVAVVATMLAGTAVDLVAQTKSRSASTGVYVFDANTGATPTDPAAVCELHVVLIGTKSDVSPQP